MFALSIVAATLIACGGGSVGDECDVEGQADKECEDGAVCGRNKAGALVCQTQCTTDQGCPGQVCGQIANTNLKGCRDR